MLKRIALSALLLVTHTTYIIKEKLGKFILQLLSNDKYSCSLVLTVQSEN